MTAQEKPYLLFDAGGTLVFPDHPQIADWLVEEGVDANGQSLFAAHNRLFYRLDDYVRQHGRLPDSDHRYFRQLLQEAHVPEATNETVERRAIEHDRHKSLWTFSHEWVGTTLAGLRNAGYQMAVISNSDGRAGQILTDLGLMHYLDTVIDSEVVGVAKPKRAIFELALEQLGLWPDEAIYIGDLFYYDVWGANQAELAAIHLDSAGLYRDWPGVHLTDVRQLPAWLAEKGWQPGRAELFPARDLPLALT